MKKFIELAHYINTWWQWKDESKAFRRFRFKVYFGYNPRTGEWE